MQAGATAPGKAPSAGWGWIHGPLFDGFYMLSGLWLAPFALYFGATDADPDRGTLDGIYLVLTALFWVGHRLSSAYLAYCTSSYRPLLTSQRGRFVWAPLATAAVVMLVLVPEGGWPWTRGERLMALVMIDFVLIAYHFAAQHYGVLSLYRVRGGQARTRGARMTDRGFALLVGGAVVVVVDSLLGGESHQEVWLRSWASTDALDDAWYALQGWGTAVVVAATAGMTALEVAGGRPSGPRLLYLWSVSVVVLTAFWAHPLVFVVLWSVQHWTAAMGLAAIVAHGDPAPGASPWYQLWHWVNRRRWRVVGLLVFASTALLPLMEVEAVADADRYSRRVVPWLADALAASSVAPALVALGFVTALLHYQLDRAVFRLSDPEVRAAVGGSFADGAPRSQPSR